MATQKEQEKPTSTGTSEAVFRKLQDMGLTVCKVCKSKIRTDLDGNIFCPSDNNNCPIMKLKNNENI